MKSWGTLGTLLRRSVIRILFQLVIGINICLRQWQVPCPAVLQDALKLRGRYHRVVLTDGLDGLLLVFEGALSGDGLVGAIALAFGVFDGLLGANDSS